MKTLKTLSLMFILAFTSQLSGQNDSIKWKYIKNYHRSNEQIKENWEQFFRMDLYDSLKASKDKLFPVYFDSYGSPYPHLSLLKGVNKSSFQSTMSPKNLRKYSLQHFFQGSDFRENFAKNIDALPNEATKRIYQRLLAHTNEWNGSSDEKIDRFYELWDSLQFSIVINDLKEKIRSSGATKIMFYVHGYNVPYSLAALQSLELQKHIRKSDQNILMIPLFWPSNNAKDCNLTQDTISPDGFDINDRAGLCDGGIQNAQLFWYYSNQAYFAAVGLRRILNGLQGTPIDITLYSHSLGATVITSAVINTFSKMQLDESIRTHLNDNWLDLKRDHPGEYKAMKKNDNLGFEIVKAFKLEELPKQRITLYMSAPAIPGEHTFADISSGVLSNISVFSTVNKKDPVLTKRNASILGKTGIVNASNFGATSLGCDYNDDRAALQQYFDSHNATDNLHFKSVEINDHDFFVYLNDSNYRSFIDTMLQNKLIPVESLSEVGRFNAKFNRLTSQTDDKDFKPQQETIFNYRKKNNLVIKRNTSVNNNTRSALDTLVKDLVLGEKPNEFSETLLPVTLEKIVTKEDPFALVMLRRELVEDKSADKSDHMKRKLIKVVDRRISETCYDNFPMYSYKNQCQRPVRFVSIRTGNDLFTPAGLYATFTNKELKQSNWYFQKNDDRDYTGSLLIEVGTDFLRAPRGRNFNSYQTVFYGFDVFTPYFKDYAIFTKNDTFNINDRPHASFQYFGWSKNGLSRRSLYRWSFFIKFGKIGGYNGSDFQAALHQDISFSPRPRGWGAQIANNGRLGISIEGAHEWDKQLINHPRDQHFWNLHLQLPISWKAGSYMTNASIGLVLTNKSFKQNNTNYINHRTRQTVNRRSDNLMYAFSFNATGVQHNTMLQGYGIVSTNESKDDTLTPKSRHKLNRSQVRPIIFNTSFLVSYTARYFTVFYKWTSFSPETYQDDIKAKRYPTDTETMKIGKRWHHFAVIGISFNVMRY